MKFVYVGRPATEAIRRFAENGKRVLSWGEVKHLNDKRLLIDSAYVRLFRALQHYPRVTFEGLSTSDSDIFGPATIELHAVQHHTGLEVYHELQNKGIRAFGNPDSDNTISLFM
jgi:hypothetical protein